MSTSTRLHQLAEHGQSVWIDFLSRDLLRSGELARLMRDDNVSGVTSNPTIFAKALSGGNSTIKVAFGTEAGLFHESGIPAIICGPGSIDQAHKPDEWVTLEQLALCEAFLRRLMDRVCIGRA